MLTIQTPIIDRFDLLLAQLSHDKVSSWSKQELINYCASKHQEERGTHFSLDDLIDDYESFYKRSIVDCVDSWNVGTIIWHDYIAVEYYAAIKMSEGPPEKITPDKVSNDDNILCWAIYLRHKHGRVACILELANHDEAKLITESINRFYFSDH
jgi:hypothetical protein